MRACGGQIGKELQKENNMKKIYAKGYLMLSAVAFCVGIFILIYGFYGSINDIKGSELLCVLSIGLMIIFLYKVLKILPNTWIKYDKDTIIISQISSKYENGYFNGR